MKFRAEGSKLGEMPGTDFRRAGAIGCASGSVRFCAHRPGESADRSGPADGFALAAAGHAKLCQLEQLGGAGAGPVWISVPRCLTGSLQGRLDGSVLADCVGGEDEIEGGSRSEEDETGLPHAGTEPMARPGGRRTGLWE